MSRRRLLEDPYSRLAIWSRRLAFFSLVAALLSILIVRSDLLEIVPALATFAGALAIAVLAILIAVAALVVIWTDGLRGIGYALSAIAIGLGLLAYPLYLGTKAYRLPAISDITTDPIDPPRFEAIARVRPRAANPVIYAGLYAAERQRLAYPEVEPLLLAATPKEAFDAALAVANKRRWRVIDVREPTANRREGRIEAIARTPVMGFRDDVVIRVRPNGEDSRIDVRSASRYGRHDFGNNAARIASLLADVEQIIESRPQKPEPQKPAPAGRQRNQPAARR